jgi:hypothetical protein
MTEQEIAIDVSFVAVFCELSSMPQVAEMISAGIEATSCR